jgi:hypothetical protein
MSEKRPSVFYLNPAHAGFPANREALIADVQRRAKRTILFGVGAYILVIVTVVLVMRLRFGDRPADGLSTLAVLLGVAITGTVLALSSTQWRLGRLYAQGQLLQGVILSVKGVGREQQDYLLEVEYRFTAPNGVEMTHKQRVVRDDLQAQPLPLVGTPVNVLYIGERSYMVL